MGLDAILPIHEVPDEQRFWVVRANGGDFAPHFRHAGVVALGHLDEFKIGDSAKPYSPDDGALKRLADKFANLGYSRGQVSSIVGQIKRFIYEIRIGDIVVTPGHGASVTFGRVIGHARVQKRPVTLSSAKTGQDSTMGFSLRRAIQWGPVVRRSSFPAAVVRSLRANQTVFNVDEHWRALHHLIYPIFRKDGHTYFSFRIDQEKDISAYAVSRLTEFLARSEVLLKAITAGVDVSQSNFDQIFYDLQDAVTLTMQAQFASSGDANFGMEDSTEIAIRNFHVKIGSKTEDALRRAFLAIVILTVAGGASSIYFGNEKLGLASIHDKIFLSYGNASKKQDLEKALKAAEAIIQDEWNKKRGQQITKDLKLNLPKYNTAPLNDPENDEPADPSKL